MRDLHDLEGGSALRTDDRRAMKIVEWRLTAQASALYAEFGFCHRCHCKNSLRMNLSVNGAMRQTLKRLRSAKISTARR
jgi:hypothetical protein